MHALSSPPPPPLQSSLLDWKHRTDKKSRDRDMDIRSSDSKIWQEIELSESYLVCSMFEEAKSLASSILKQLCSDEIEVEPDMLESAAMVLLQSLHHLRRTSQILYELKQSFSSVESIPVQVLLTGVCFRLSEGSGFSDVGEFLQEFLGKWRFVGGRCYVPEPEAGVVEGRLVMGVNEYVEVVEVYVIKFLAATLNDLDMAISWVEKAQLPDDTRQGLLRRLHSLHSAKTTVLSQPLSADDDKARPSNLKQANVLEADRNDAVDGKQQAVLRLSKRVEPCFWWFRTINLKFGNARLVVSNRKIVLSCLILLTYWILRRKRVSLKRIVERQALNLKKAVVDLWLLAFSYQVNPLAAVQSSPAAPLRGGQSV